MRRIFTIRLLRRGENTTMRINSKALDAMLDMVGRMLCAGELEAISVQGHSVTNGRKRGEMRNG